MILKLEEHYVPINRHIFPEKVVGDMAKHYKSRLFTSAAFDGYAAMCLGAFETLTADDLAEIINYVLENEGDIEQYSAQLVADNVLANRIAMDKAGDQTDG